MAELVLFLFHLSASYFGVASTEVYADPIKELSGPWDFYWQELYSEDSILLNQIPDTTITNPGTWNQYQINGEEIGGWGYATYVIRYYSDQEVHAGLRLRGFYSAYNLYVNRDWVGGNGLVGKSPENSSLVWQPQVLPVILQAGENIIALEVSNYQHAKGGFFYPIKLGNLYALQRNQETDIMIDVFTAGAFMMIGIFFLGMFFTWRRDKDYLIYVILSLGYAIRILSNGTHVLKSMFSQLSWQVLVGIEYLSFYAVWWSSLALIAFVLPRHIYRPFNWLFWGFMLSVVILPLHLYTHILLPSVAVGFLCYVITLAFLAFRKKQFSTRTYYAILIFLMLALGGWVLEFLMYAKVFDSFVALPNIFRLFAVLSLAFLISERYSADYEEVERLKIEAEKQKKVIEDQFYQMNDQQELLKFRNKEIETLLKEVHHRVKNNLQLITSLLDVEEHNDQPNKAISILEDSQARIATMSLIHQNLYMNDNLSTIPLVDYLKDLFAKLKEIHQLKKAPTINMKVGDYAFDVDTMVPLGLALNELITNCFKYPPKANAFHIEIKCQLTHPGTYQLSVRDQGNDLPQPFEILLQEGHGLRLANRLCHQLLGELTHEYDDGNVFTIRFLDTEKRKEVE